MIEPTHISYVIRSILNYGNKVEVNAGIIYGHYENLLPEQVPEEIIPTRYVIDNDTTEVYLKYEKCPVENEEIKRDLLAHLDKIKGDKIIKEN